jgi:hypothetical protein
MWLVICNIKVAVSAQAETMHQASHFLEFSPTGYSLFVANILVRTMRCTKFHVACIFNISFSCKSLLTRLMTMKANCTFPSMSTFNIKILKCLYNTH